MVPMSSDNPMLLYKDILHVRISNSKECEVEVGPGLCRLTVSHGAFRNEGSVSYQSSALAAIEESDEMWLFFDWWTGSWADNTVRFQLQALIRNNMQMKVALFDEALMETGVIAYASSDSCFAYDYYGNIPSSMLIRRDIFCDLIRNVHSLYPYPVQKLSDAARKAGVQIEKIHEVISKKLPVQDYLMVSADKHSILRGKHKESKKILVITHELSWTGAPIVLAEACIDVLKPAGYEIMVLSPKEGPLSEKYLENGIPVMIIPEIASLDSSLLYSLVQPFDAVMVNTIVPYASIQILNALKKPVFWWIHECEIIYPCVEEYLPKRLNDHIHVFCVGKYALDVLKKYRSSYNAKSLIYGLQDENTANLFKQHLQNRRFKFATVGSVVHLKGQDILAKAISMLRDEIREKCEFLFVGKAEDSDILAAIKNAEKQYPENVRYIGQLARDTLSEIYPEVDCIICASRYDCMPTFVAEGMMYGKPAICSENTGMAPILASEDAGFVYSDNDPSQLANAITQYVSLSDEERKVYTQKARGCFDDYFSLGVFRKNLLQVMDALITPALEMTSYIDE